MLAYLVLLLAVLSRLLPHALHGVGMDFTAVGGGLLFFGSRGSRWRALIAVVAMALTDVYLTCVVYGMQFHVSNYLFTWAWYACVCLLAGILLRRVTVARVTVAVVGYATSFFLLSNFMVWAMDGLYPHTAAGLGMCFLAGVPFFSNDLVSTAASASVFFGLPSVARLFVHTWQVAKAQHPIG